MIVLGRYHRIAIAALAAASSGRTVFSFQVPRATNVHDAQYSSTRRRQHGNGATLLRMSVGPRLNVALDQPLPVDIFGVARKKAVFGSSLLWRLKYQLTSSAGALRIFGLATLFVGLYFTYFLSLGVNNAESPSRRVLKLVKDSTLKMVEYTKALFVKETECVPMPFDLEKDDGWGVCTLRSIKPFGKTSFYQCDFDLPESNYVLPLEMGQILTVCGLDRDDKAAQAEFYPFPLDRKSKAGSFSILVPDPDTVSMAFSTATDSIGAMNDCNDAQQAHVVRLLQNDMGVGDEIAIKPGRSRLDYTGRLVPVTEIVYFAAGTGIAPVLDQVRALLPESPASTVESVSVVWINDAANDFDVTTNLLEKEYNKFSQKLAVSCIVDNLRERSSLSDNKEILEAVPSFQPGTLAVLAGPSASMKKAVAFLKETKGFPRDSICVL